MEVLINAVVFKSPDELDKFTIQVTEKDYKIVKQKLINERKKIIKYFQRLKSDGIIKSDRRPKNKKIQKQLNELAKSKKVLKQSIEKLSLIF